MNISPEACTQLALIDHQVFLNWQELEIAYSLLMRNKKTWKGEDCMEDAVSFLREEIENLKQKEKLKSWGKETV